VYKNKSFARGEDVEDPQTLYDKVVKLGGLPKRLDRLIEESKHLQVHLQEKYICKNKCKFPKWLDRLTRV
jgi:hypothetical protein